MTSSATIDEFLIDKPLPEDRFATVWLNKSLLKPFFPLCSRPGCTETFGFNDRFAGRAMNWFRPKQGAGDASLTHTEQGAGTEEDFSGHDKFLRDRYNYNRITLKPLCRTHLKDALETDWKAPFRDRDIALEQCGTVVGKHRMECSVLVRSGPGEGPRSLEGKRRCWEGHAFLSISQSQSRCRLAPKRKRFRSQQTEASSGNDECSKLMIELDECSTDTSKSRRCSKSRRGKQRSKVYFSTPTRSADSLHLSDQVLTHTSSSDMNGTTTSATEHDTTHNTITGSHYPIEGRDSSPILAASESELLLDPFEGYSSIGTTQLGHGFYLSSCGTDEGSAQDLKANVFIISKNGHEILLHDTETAQGLDEGFDCLQSIFKAGLEMRDFGLSGQEREALTLIMASSGG